MKRIPSILNLRTTLPLLVMGSLVTALAVHSASAGSITNVVPTKLGVYQGVLVVAPTASNSLEIGNGGRDIGSTGDLYFRPGSLPQSSSIRLSATSGRPYLYIPVGGALCLSQGTGVLDCKTGWPASGTGDTYWTATPSGSPTALTPSPSAPEAAIRIGKRATPIPQVSGRAFEVYGNSTNVFRVNGNLTTGVWEDDGTGTGTYVLKWGNVLINGNLDVNSDEFTYQLQSYSNIPFYTDQDKYTGGYAPYSFGGTGSGIDADKIDGTTTLPFYSYFCRGGSNSGTSCINAAHNGPDNTKCLGGGTCDSTNLYIRSDVGAGSSYTYNFICLKSNDSYLCTGGTNAGTPCTNLAGNGPDNTKCLNGGTCSTMCSSQVAVCPKDPVPNAYDPVGGFKCYGGATPNAACNFSETSFTANDAACPDCVGAACPKKYCTGGPSGGSECNSSGDCFGGYSCLPRQTGVCSAYRCSNSDKACSTPDDCGGAGTCQRGEVFSQGGYQNSSCSDSGNPPFTCPYICKTFKQTFNRCDGGAGAGSCSYFGDHPYYTNGHSLHTNAPYGACIPFCPGGCGNYPAISWTLVCDCFVDQYLEYNQALPPGNGAELCTENFQ